MGRRRNSGRKLKKVHFEFIDPESLIGKPIYALLRDLVDRHHEDLVAARIGLAWCTSWKADADGRITLGKCHKASDLHRELAAYDFVILLSRSFWTDSFTTELQRRALLDHELQHAALKYENNGEPAVDERGRRVYRMRKHDLEEFAVIAARYGCYKRDLEQFAESLTKSRASSTVYIGREMVRRKLAAIGLIVSATAVLEWSDAERRDAFVWAGLNAKARETSPAPAHVLAASETTQQRPDAPQLPMDQADPPTPATA